jgi:DNA-binding CsgD family transcriptional regulator
VVSSHNVAEPLPCVDTAFAVQFRKVQALPPQKVAALLSTVAAMGELDDPLAASPAVLEMLDALVPSEMCTYWQLDRIRKRSVLNVWWHDGDAGVSTAADEDEVDGYFRLRHQHPVCGYRERTGDWTSPRKASDFVSLREFQRGEIWNELYRREGVNYWLDVGLPREPNGQTRVFVFTRRHRDFDEEDRLILKLLKPHLLRRFTAVGDAAKAAAALAAVDGDGNGDGPHDLVLCSPGGVIEFASRRARQTLETYFGRACTHLPEPLRGAIAVAWGPWRTVRGDRALTIRVVRAETLFVLLLDERDTRLERLTRREREILDRVALGGTDAEIAAALQVAPATVGKHLEHVYERLGVHTRTAAAAVLSR